MVKIYGIDGRILTICSPVTRMGCIGEDDESLAMNLDKVRKMELDDGTVVYEWDGFIHERNPSILTEEELAWYYQQCTQPKQ